MTDSLANLARELGQDWTDMQRRLAIRGVHPVGIQNGVTVYDRAEVLKTMRRKRRTPRG